MFAAPPRKPKGETAQRVYLDLILRHPYDPEFGRWILAQPSGVTLPVLLDIVKREKHPFLLRNAVFILRCYNDPAVLPALRGILRKTRDRVIRNRALAALVRWRDASIVEWLCQKAGGPDRSFRSYALWALGRIGSSRGIKTIVNLVNRFSGDREFLWAAIPALGRMAKSASPEIRRQVEEALLSLRDPSKKIGDPSPWKGEGNRALLSPDPSPATAPILQQRILLALALVRHQTSIDWLKDAKAETILKPNRDLYNETLKSIIK